jgi:leucyl/phenylalanyl-tRNA--protein transferase
MRKLPLIKFPNPRSAGEDGLLCFGGDLEVATLLQAYGNGIFPWPQEGLPLLWFSPFERGVLDFERLHWSRRFLRSLKAGAPEGENKGAAKFKVTFNQAFSKVIAECALVPRSHETGTWILPDMEEAYVRFHEAGYAHSVECWQNDELVGGLYGVYVDGVFSGESMFYKASDASKRCLFALTAKLQENGVRWMDIQMVTPVLEKIGGHLISRDDYLARLEKAHIQSPKSIELKGEFVWPSK